MLSQWWDPEVGFRMDPPHPRCVNKTSPRNLTLPEFIDKCLVAFQVTFWRGG